MARCWTCSLPREFRPSERRSIALSGLERQAQLSGEARGPAVAPVNLADPQLRAACRDVLLAAFSDEPGFRWVVGDGDYAGYVRLQGTLFLPGPLTLARCENYGVLVPGIRFGNE